MSYEMNDTHSLESVDILNTVDWNRDVLPEKKSSSIVDINQEIKELQTNIFQKISLKLWLVNLLLHGRILEDQYNNMLEEYDRIITELVNRRGVVWDAYTEDILSLNAEFSKSNIYLAEIEKKYEIADISEEEYLVKKRLFKWEINHYKNEISKRTDVLSFLENPNTEISNKKYNELNEEIKTCLNNVNNLNPSDSISFKTIKRTKISMEKIIEHFKGYNMAQQKHLKSLESDKRNDRMQKGKNLAYLDESDARDNSLKLLDSLDFDETNVVRIQAIHPSFSDKHDIKDHPMEQESKTGEIIEENSIIRVECPYSNFNGKKCKVVAFSTNKADAYKKLNEHIITSHPDKIEDFTDILRKSIS